MPIEALFITPLGNVPQKPPFDDLPIPRQPVGIIRGFYPDGSTAYSAVCVKVDFVTSSLKFGHLSLGTGHRDTSGAHL